MPNKTDDPSELTIVVGSYTVSLPHVVARGLGVTVLKFTPETGAFRRVSDFTAVRNPSYIAFSGRNRILYAIEEMKAEDGASVAMLQFDGENFEMSLVGHIDTKGDFPCHISLDNEERRLFISNYGSGNLVAIALDEAGRPTGSPANIQRQGKGVIAARQEGPHIHQAVASPDGRHVLLCDMGTDEIARHSLTGGMIEVVPDIVLRTGAGRLPRHLVFAPDGKRFFVVHEFACLVGCYAYSENGFQLLDEISTLPAGFEGDSACAAIRIHPGGGFIYVSNRGHDSIAVIRADSVTGVMECVAWHHTRGLSPRDFAIDSSGKYLVVANQDSDVLSAFLVDQVTGVLRSVGGSYKISSPASVLFVNG